MDFPDVENVRVEVLEPSGSSKAKRRRGAPVGDPSKIGQKGYSKYTVTRSLYQSKLLLHPRGGSENDSTDSLSTREDFATSCPRICSAIFLLTIKS